ncbi:MAG TPA: radical SAM protein, partial [Bacteroidales bacterium]|nr:radical SAM protein [Bacteroidales bacterium]
ERVQEKESYFQFVSRLAQAGFNYEKCDLSGLKGISYRYSKVHHSQPEKSRKIIFPGCLDNYSSPYLNGIIPPSEGYNAGIVTARGCNQNCTYCNCAVLSGRKFSTHSTERVISEIDLISRNNNNQTLTIQDDTFTLIPRRAGEICRAIIENRIRVRLACITRCDLVDDNLLDLMKEAGFVSLTFSLESANPLTLRRIGKVHVPEDIPSDNMEKELKFIESFEHAAAYAKKIGIETVAASIMVGLPGESLAEARHTVDTINNNSNIDYYAHNFLNIFSGTHLSHCYTRYGYKVRFINGNPAFTKMTYPVDVIRKVYISGKSHLHSLKRSNDSSTIEILSLLHGKNVGSPGFRNIIIESDYVSRALVKWLNEILTINGTIIQLYSDEKLMNRLHNSNYSKFIRWLSPSLKIRNYCFSRSKGSKLLLSRNSILLNIRDENENIRFCNLDCLGNQPNPSVSFSKALCLEGDSGGADVYSFLTNVNRGKDTLSFLLNQKPLPYIAGLCKWTRKLANCISRNTLIIDKENKTRFCWFGQPTGKVGDSFDSLITNLENEKKEASARRNCTFCPAEGSCIKCPFPFPQSEDDFCRNKRAVDLHQTAELICSLDEIKKYLNA